MEVDIKRSQNQADKQAVGDGRGSTWSCSGDAQCGGADAGLRQSRTCSGALRACAGPG